MIRVVATRFLEKYMRINRGTLPEFKVFHEINVEFEISGELSNEVSKSVK